MSICKHLWDDEAGFILSAEAVLVATIAVLGVVVGLNMVARAVNEELQDLAFAFRSLDQSYGFEGFAAGGAWKAGSSYIQQDVETSLEQLRTPRARPADEPADDRPPVFGMCGHLSTWDLHA
jgi:hypothetical protein